MTIRIVACLTAISCIDWDKAVTKVLFGYSTHSTIEYSSCFELLYNIKLKIPSNQQNKISLSITSCDHKTEIFALNGLKASKLDVSANTKNAKDPVVVAFEVEDLFCLRMKFY